MESYVLKRNEELCSRLAMNFDEANELFGNETLSSMQMVQVNGGAINWKAIWSAIVQVADFINDMISIGGSGSGSPATGSSNEFSVSCDGQGKITVTTKGFTFKSMDSMKVITGNGTTTVTIYNPTFGPSSSSNPAGPTVYH